MGLVTNMYKMPEISIKTQLYNIITAAYLELVREVGECAEAEGREPLLI